MGGVNPEPSGANPFEAPSAAPGMDRRGVWPLASRGSRATAVSLDACFYFLAFLPGFLAVWQGGEDATLLFGGLAGVALLGLVVYQTYLVATTGQSIGKRLIGIRIVRSDGSPVEFVHGVLIRSWALGLAQVIPIIGGFIPIIDALMIFSEDRRCLHDRLADTIVVDVSGEGDDGHVPTNPWAR